MKFSSLLAMRIKMRFDFFRVWAPVCVLVGEYIMDSLSFREKYRDNTSYT